MSIIRALRPTTKDRPQSGVAVLQLIYFSFFVSLGVAIVVGVGLWLTGNFSAIADAIRL